jgi:hypothetical protein
MESFDERDMGIILLRVRDSYSALAFSKGFFGRQFNYNGSRAPGDL